ncbi:hypothetical protein ACS5NO_05070 [Larkinella sp. GY13]
MSHPYGIVFGFSRDTVSTKWIIPTGLFLVFRAIRFLQNGLSLRDCFWFFARHGFYKMDHPYGIVFGFSRDTVSTKLVVPTELFFFWFFVRHGFYKMDYPYGIVWFSCGHGFYKMDYPYGIVFGFSCGKLVTTSVPLRQPIL